MYLVSLLFAPPILHPANYFFFFSMKKFLYLLALLILKNELLTIYGMNVQMQEQSDDEAECKSNKKDREDKPRWGVNLQ